MQFQELQKQFSAHIRDPEANPRPADVEDRRMKIYRELFFNNVNGFLESGFPVLRSLYDDQRWQQLVRRFFASHHATSPYFLDISKEFVLFLAQQYELQHSDPPFLQELAHYEWVELAVSSAQDSGQLKPLFNVQKQPLYMSETAQVVCYHFPVQTISVDNQPQQADEQPSYICVYRDQQDEVQFLALNMMTALLLDTLSQQPGMTLAQVCEALQRQAPQFNYQQLYQGALQIAEQLAQRQVLQTLDC
ncbi:HvfC family RiPP maturation protein [Pseudoalteromonas ruthenica]|uniref:HvfC family RiPP maturation protein n=1 Tax=Pseudoalteromonas ruthenica TaxID=151081 RepID=UPI00110A4B03|nr:putative DNA-binding domain-containing protein [Pseudoalteromonas ruthenica]TMO48574.1 DUF2063 domain-containing protein [Pseudoalteromonas ruthenica]TMO50963.1 DUF2063 domain-containing protein [Pseudoalteromonas ruthenica]